MRWQHYLVVGFTIMFGLAAIGMLLTDSGWMRPVEAAVPSSKISRPAN